MTTFRTAPLAPVAKPSEGRLAGLFLFSGFAALIYQIVWQRVLFTAFGVNIEAVTLIVAVFMFGLGVGSLVGGQLSKRFPEHLLQLFILCEVLIGLFGLVSVPLIKAVTALTIHGSLLTIGLTTYALLCIPTVFMGATLPMLVSYLHRRMHNVGQAVGLLYFANTIGSAIACFATVFLLFFFVGLQASVLIAALCNFLVAGFAYLLVGSAAEETEAADESAEKPTAASRSRLGLPLVMLLAAATGYIALSQEILWMRVLSFVTADRAYVFGLFLGILLLGVARGALWASRLARRGPDACLAFVAVMLGVSSVLYYFSLPLSAQLLTIQSRLGIVACFAMVGITALLTGGIFPALCHYAIRSGAVGVPLSWIYFANIVGSTAGPLLTGFVLLNEYSLEHNILALALAGAVLAVLVALMGALSGTRRTVLVAGLTVVMGAAVLTHEQTYHALFEKLQHKDNYSLFPEFKQIRQNRSGTVTVYADPKGGADIICGGGAYDGRFSTDPVANSNMIRRAYMMAGLHRQPQDVLEIGLSSGSWARVIADSEAVQRLTVVEINPAYPAVLERYDEVKSVLSDPKVTLVFDDGRRWLNRHPEARFDFILMNTTFHWRNMISNLVSADFLSLCKSHLKPGGVIYYNTTGSEDMVYTAAQVFQHVTYYVTFVAASDSPFDMTPAERRANLLRFQQHGQRTFEASEARQKVLEEMANAPLPDLGDQFRQRSDLWFITDDNMATEFKVPGATWAKRGAEASTQDIE